MNWRKLASNWQAVILFIALFSITNSVLAQGGATTGNITGKVTDSQGAVILGAEIIVQQRETNFSRHITVNDQGVYQILQLPPGNYQVVAQANGFLNESQPIKLTVGTTGLVEFVLKLESTQEVIEVKASNSLLERTESSTNLESERIQSLPINKRNYLEFALTTARVVADRLPPNGTTATSGFSFNGQTARGNSITIDGISNNDLPNGGVRTSFSQDAIQEFQVVTDGFSAEFGRALGGIINIVTKSGTNSWHGNLFGFLRNRATSAREVFAAQKAPFSQYQFGATLGGSIIKDRAFLFASFERLSTKQNTIVTIDDSIVRAAQQQNFPISNGARPFALGKSLFLVRGDYRFSPHDQLTFRYNSGYEYNGSFETFGDTRGGLVSETTDGTQRLRDVSFTATNTYINEPLNLINETRILYGRVTQSVAPVDANNPLVQLNTPQGRVVFGGNIILPQPSDGRIFQLIDNLSLIRGAHQIKIGGDFFYADVLASKTMLPLLKGGLAIFTPIDFAQQAGIPGLPTFSALEAFDPHARSANQQAFLQSLAVILPNMIPGFPILDLPNLSLPVAYVQGFGSSNVGTVAKLGTTFIQDDFKLKTNLLLKLGLRYDVNRVAATPSTNGNLSPRLAIAYSPKRLANLRLSGSYGLFFGAPVTGNSTTVRLFGQGYQVATLTFPFSLAPYALSNHRFPQSDQLPPSLNFIPQLGLNYRYDKNFQDSYTQQINLNIGYLFNKSTEISLSYSFVRGLRLLGLRNINPIVHPVLGDSTASATTGRLDNSQGDLNEFESAFDSYYHGATIEVRRRFSNNFTLLANYTFSKALDNTTDSVRADFQPPADALNIGAEKSYSVEDLRSRFLVSATYNFSSIKSALLKDFEFATIITLESGRPYNLTSATDLNGDGVLSDRPNGIARNLGITPGFANVNLRLSRSFNIGKLQLQGLFEVFNLFNRVNINQVNTIFVPDSNGQFQLPLQKQGRFIAPQNSFRTAFAPRQCQLGFRLNF